MPNIQFTKGHIKNSPSLVSSIWSNLTVKIFENFFIFSVEFEPLINLGPGLKCHSSIHSLTTPLHIFFLIPLSITHDGETSHYNRDRIQIQTADYLGIFIISTTTVCQGPRPNLEQRSITALGGWVLTEREPLCVLSVEGRADRLLTSVLSGESVQPMNTEIVLWIHWFSPTGHNNTYS